jgi:hypothetical protein
VPGDKLYNDEAAVLADVQAGTWRDYTTPSKRRSGRLIGPAPDGVEIDRGHARPWWHRATVLQWKANRPGRGARTDLLS